MEYDQSGSYAHFKSTSRENRTISLSIEDLMTDPTVGGKQQPPVHVDTESIDYKTELAKLLAKSRGTAYEKTLKRFVESKYREIQLDESERTRKALAGQIDLASLSTSKYDSPRKGSILEDSVLNSYRKSKIEEMAKPLERNVWKGPENPVSLASTNLIGRQRPSPMKDAPYAIHTNSNSLAVTTNSTVVRTLSSPDKNHRTSRRTRSRSPQMTINHQLAAPAVPSVSTSEFNSWLDQNRKWQQKQKDKIERERRRFERKIAEGAKPRLFPKSHQLGEEANLRMSQRIIEEVEERNQQLIQQRERQREEQREADAQQEEEDDLLSEFDLPLHDDLAGSELNDARSVVSGSVAAPPAVLTPTSLTVYDRLAARGRSYAEKKLNWQPPDDNQPHKPVILEASLRMLKNRSSLSPNRPARRDASVSPSPSARNFLRGSGISKVLSLNGTAAAPLSPTHSLSSAAALSSHQSALEDHLKARSDSKLTVDNSTSDTVHSFIVTSSSLRLSDLLLQRTEGPEEQRECDASGGEEREGRSMGRDSRRGRDRGSSASTTTGSVYGGTTLLRRSNSELRLLAQTGIERSRSLSASRRERERETEKRRSFNRSEAVPAPFTPLLVAERQTSRLLSKSKSSFTERNCQSVENRFIRNVISKKCGSPGPGYYSNIHNGNVLSPSRVRPTASSCSPSRAVAVSSKGLLVARDASPGHRGYSFSREPLNRLVHHSANAAPADGKVNDLMDTLTELGSSWNKMRKSSSGKQLDIDLDVE